MTLLRAYKLTQVTLVPIIVRCIAGICARGGYGYAVSVYHYAQTLAYSAQADTLQYHGNAAQAELSLDNANWHIEQLEVRALSTSPADRQNLTVAQALMQE